MLVISLTVLAVIMVLILLSILVIIVFLLKYCGCLWKNEKQYYDDNTTEKLSQSENRYFSEVQLSNEHNSEVKIV